MNSALKSAPSGRSQTKAHVLNHSGASTMDHLMLESNQQPETIRGKRVSWVGQKTGQVTWVEGSESINAQVALRGS